MPSGNRPGRASAAAKSAGTSLRRGGRRRSSERDRTVRSTFGLSATGKSSNDPKRSPEFVTAYTRTSAGVQQSKLPARAKGATGTQRCVGRKHSVVSATDSPQKLVDGGDAVDQLNVEWEWKGSMRYRRNDRVRHHCPAAPTGIDDRDLHARSMASATSPAGAGPVRMLRTKVCLRWQRPKFSPAPRRCRSTCP